LGCKINSIPNAPQGYEDELLSGGRFIAMFAALSNREYFDSEDGADGFRRRATRRVRCTIGLKQKTQYQTHYGAVKISFRRAGNLKRYILNSNGKPSVSKDTTS
jgi:hypothetical protein